MQLIQRITARSLFIKNKQSSISAKEVESHTAPPMVALGQANVVEDVRVAEVQFIELALDDATSRNSPDYRSSIFGKCNRPDTFER